MYIVQVKERLEKQQDNQSYSSKGPFPNKVTLDKGEKIWAFLTSGRPTKALVVKDYGDTVLIEKEVENDYRFKWVTVHKARLSKRL